MTKETIRFGQISIDVMLEAADTNGSVSMFELTVPPGERVPAPHYHENFDETIYGLEGTMTFTVGDMPIDVTPGGTLFIPRGAAHGFDNLKQQTAKVLAVVTPARLGAAYFKEIAAIINADGVRDMEKIKSTMIKYGLIPLPVGGTK